MSAKRTPQTAAKRAREQRVRERRELKAAKRQAANLARRQGETGSQTGDGPDIVDPGAGEPTRPSNG